MDGCHWRAARIRIVKEIRVFDFPDCEVVYYEATHKLARLLRGIRGQIRGERTGGLATLQRYERRLGFDANDREKVNLFDLLVTAQS